jgi:hypothetical protein
VKHLADIGLHRCQIERAKGLGVIEVRAIGIGAGIMLAQRREVEAAGPPIRVGHGTGLGGMRCRRILRMKPGNPGGMPPGQGWPRGMWNV